MFDLVHMTMRHAVALFGGRDRIFNGACFAQAFRQTSGVDALLDGRQVMAILCGRRDVEILGGGSHYKLIKQNDSDRKADEAIRRLEEALSKPHGFKSGDWVRVIRTHPGFEEQHPIGSRRKIDEIMGDSIAFVGDPVCLCVSDVEPCDPPTFEDMRDAIREAGGNAWDNIEDPVQFLKELRGED